MSKILLIEDDQGNADVIQQMLESEAFEVRTINRSALIDQVIDSFAPDLIVMDIMLGEGDGRVHCNSIKQNPQAKHIPVMLITAMLESQVALIPCSPEAIMYKPFDYLTLTQNVRKLLKL